MLQQMIDCQHFLVRRQAAGLLVTTALHVMLLNRPLFRWLPHAFKHKNQSIKADRSVCVFALTEGTGQEDAYLACSCSNRVSVGLQRDSLKRKQISTLSSKAQCDCPV